MNKYQKEIKPGVQVDVYDVLKAFSVTCPATAHAIKKLLCPGQRGVKDASQDLSEAISSIERAIELLPLDQKGRTKEDILNEWEVHHSNTGIWPSIHGKR